MDSSLYMVALGGFLAGSFGYVTVRFLLWPILAYRRLRGRVVRALRVPPVPEDLNRLSAEIAECYAERLPNWYRIHLQHRRGEAPLEAVRQLSAMANTRKEEHIRRQREKIERALGLTPPG